MGLPTISAESAFSSPFSGPFQIAPIAGEDFYILAENNDNIQLEATADLILLEAAA